MAEFRPIAKWLNARRVLVLLGLAGWVALIIVGSGPRANESNWIGLPELADLATVAFLVLVAWGLVVFVRLLRTPATATTTAEAPRGRFGMWITLGVLLILVTTNPDIIERLRLDRDDLEVEQEEDQNLRDGDQGEPPPTLVQIDQGDVVVLLVIVGVGAGLWHWTRRRVEELAALTTADPGSDVDLVPVLDEATRLLQLEGQPRAAVMAAYANLEHSLSGEGHPRRRSETPTEHLERVLAHVPIDAAPIVELGRLYEIARFSDHPVTVGDRDRAVAELNRVRWQLEAWS